MGALGTAGLQAGWPGVSTTSLGYPLPASGREVEANRTLSRLSIKGSLLVCALI